jgi:polysaccharide chain length determinant protein (PEP-CTERM system associated)
MEAKVTVLPGKKYTPEDLIRLALKRAWLIVIPAALGAVLAYGWSKRLPNQFRSETLIMLVPQRIPDTYVKTTVTTRIEDKLATLEDQILSRSRLERIILDLNLYEPLRRQFAMEDVVQRMRADIMVKIESKESFRVSYVSHDPKVAQKATERLASLFIEENLRDRENLAEDTNQFLESQLQDARRRLVEQEKKLEQYRRRYSGELPTQANANLQAIQGAQLQLQALTDAMDRGNERRLMLERQLVDLQTPEPVVAAGPAASANPDAIAGETTAQQIEAAKARLQVLLLRDKPDHPDVRALQRVIRDLEAKQEAELKDAPLAAKPIEKLPTATELARQKRLRDVKAQIDDLDRELHEKQQREKQLREVVAQYQAKLDIVPTRESELVELTRDYTTLQTTYQNLLAKREESKLAANLERRNIGEQFKVLDPARVPERLFSPNRVQITEIGTGIGLALGLLLVGFLEYRDASFKSEEDVVRLCQLPVLALVPVMASAEEERSRRRWTLVVRIAAVFAVIASAAAIAAWRYGF